ncbi:hypothetical protein M430DRAFT_185898 [Amorphotheca resinae ATCC 22711]|uniref:Uncharacterized protein n=1 Tax=Amorphotheca resinae ATCC 22711 TaxID=857342 RepID=A0A2T3AQD4_AMORE|nr:hypothetical protein M430DRAFT_185898 [Amorphotheca resinae ATCC 22711]PSS08479.1 hypothetical protein M430DRAFT_185898 [Amorphotheca resinae ATCC 22711]
MDCCRWIVVGGLLSTLSSRSEYTYSCSYIQTCTTDSISPLDDSLSPVSRERKQNNLIHHSLLCSSFQKSPKSLQLHRGDSSLEVRCIALFSADEAISMSADSNQIFIYECANSN